MNADPIELHLHTVDSLLKELISGRPILVNGNEFVITSQESRAILNWYKNNQEKWDKANREEDVNLIVKTLSQTPPSFTTQVPKTQKGALKYHLEKIEINQFGGVNKFSENKNDVLEFDLQKPITLFQGHNGAGKTSLVSAICWCLCGMVYRSQNPPQKPDKAIDLKIRDANGQDIIKQASIITPIPSSNYVQSLTEDRIPLNTWVKLSFINDEGKNVGYIKRSLCWKSNRGAVIIEKIEGIDALELDPIALEIGTKIPDLIPYLQLGSASDLGSAIAKLTGLHSIIDLVKHASKSKEKLIKALPGKANDEISKINLAYNQKRDELIKHFNTYTNIKPVEDIPLASENELLKKLDIHIKTFDTLLSESLVKTKEILGESFNPDNQDDRDDLTKYVGVAIDALEIHSIRELNSAKKLAALKDLISDIEKIENRIQQILNEAAEIDELANEPDLEKRQQLYARVSGWIIQNKHDHNICPVCLESLSGKTDPVTKKHIVEHIQEHLDNPKEFLRHTINEWGTKHINEIKSKFQGISIIDVLPSSPQDLIKQLFAEELFAKPCFKLTMAPLKESTRLLADKAIQILPVYDKPKSYELPNSIKQNCSLLLPFLNKMQQILAFVKWRSGVDEECKKVFEIIRGKKDKLPVQVADYTLRECLETLQNIINNASPVKTALEKLKELRDKIKINRKEQEDLLTQYEKTSNAIEDIIKLGDLVDNQIRSLMQKLSGRAKEWKTKLYHPAYTGHPEFVESEISANGALQIQAEIQGTRTETQHISNSSDLRSTLLAVYFALWEYLYGNRGGISLIILDDLNELFDQRNFRKYSKSLPEIIEGGAKLIVTTNNRQFSDFVNKAFKGEDIQRHHVHPLSENREHLGLALFVEDIEKKRSEYENNKNDDSAAKDYIEELRNYLEQQLGDILCDPKFNLKRNA